MTEKSLNSQFNTESLSHLGILAGVLKRVRFVERVDKILPVAKEKGAKTTIGERSAAIGIQCLRLHR